MTWDDMHAEVERMRADGWTFRLMSTKDYTYIARFEKRRTLQEPTDTHGDEVYTAEDIAAPIATNRAAFKALHRII